ncbi:MAG: type II 3-dehydroquinate dehydratase [bacterium]|nr:type II 3-dehydroquinate dehydratase [bacterium]
MKRYNILVIHGPNLQLLGLREKQIYGTVTISEINKALKKLARESHAELKIIQANDEGTIVDTIDSLGLNWADGILINPAAYTHTSIAIRDAIVATNRPTIEIHLSNIYARESFRHKSYIAPVAAGQISGLGLDSYLFGLQALLNILSKKENQKIKNKNKLDV